MRKLLIVLLCLLLALPASAEEPDRAALTDEWARLLSYQEIVQLAETWALDYAERYFASGTWKDLLMARLAASSAYTVLLCTEVPAASLPKEQYALWMQQGHDLTHIPMEFALLARSHEESLAGMAYLQEALHHNVFWQPHQNTLQNWVALQQRILATERMLCCSMTNGLVLSAPEALHEAEQQRFVTACPTLFSGHSEWGDDMDALEAAYAAGLDQLQELYNDRYGILGQVEIFSKLLLSLIEKGDFAAIRQHAVPITGLPACLTEPPWANPEIEYLWSDENNDLWCAMPGEALDSHAVTTKLVWRSISRSAFDAYVEELLHAGLKLLSDTASPEKRTVYLRAGVSEIGLSWTASRTLFLSSEPTVCMTPTWLTE